jgi:hypothetical protein
VYQRPDPSRFFFDFAIGVLGNFDQRFEHVAVHSLFSSDELFEAQAHLVHRPVNERAGLVQLSDDTGHAGLVELAYAGFRGGHGVVVFAGVERDQRAPAVDFGYDCHYLTPSNHFCKTLWTHCSPQM